MLEAEIVKLREAVEALTAALEKNPVVDALTPEPAAPAAQDENDISFEMLKDATLKASRAGHKGAIREKLAEMNVPKIQDLAPEQTIAFYNWLNTLEAK